MKKQKERKTAGITLVALVVTIVVLLILAGITITLLFGENGVIAKAQLASFATEMSKVEENVRMKQANYKVQFSTGNLFDETLEERSDIKVPDTLKQEVMYIREGLPQEKSPANYEAQYFDIKGLYVIDKETGNGKQDTYAYDEVTGKVFKIPQTKIGGKVYHSMEGGGVEPIYKTIQDEANVTVVDNEYYYEPDLKGFDAKNTQIVYYSSDFSKQTTKVAEEYIKEGKKNEQTISGETYQFHSYGKQQWANVKTVANGLESWWVWIPRYAYKANGTSDSKEPIGAIYVGLDNKPLNPKYNGVLPEGYEVHPAFNQEGNLKGIWMSKYEPSYKEAGRAVVDDKILAPNMEGFDKNNTYIELYDSTTNTFTSEVKLADANLGTINSSKQWYDYTKQQYANIKTVANGLESWWVWIPRYAYRVKESESNHETGILDGGTNGKIDIIFVDTNNKPLNTKDYPNRLPEGYEVHPAFNQVGNLQGIWMSKYEPSYKEGVRAVVNEKVLAPNMKGFDDKNNTYIELYDSTTNTFTSEVKLADANLGTVNSSKQWYDYTKQQYANIKTVANGLESWWVWIPRYAYRIAESESNYETSLINANGKMDVIFVDTNDKPLNTKDYPDGLPEGYEVHPAFNQGGNLQGIWMSKYEPSQK